MFLFSLKLKNKIIETFLIISFVFCLKYNVFWFIHCITLYIIEQRGSVLSSFFQALCNVKFIRIRRNIWYFSLLYFQHKFLSWQVCCRNMDLFTLVLCSECKGKCFKINRGSTKNWFWMKRLRTKWRMSFLLFYIFSWLDIVFYPFQK